MNSTPISVSQVPVMAGIGRAALHRAMKIACGGIKGLASGAFWTLVASVAAALSQWLLLMVTAKLGSAEMVGQLAMSFAIVAPIQALADLALRPVLATDAGRDFRFPDYVRLRGMTIVLFVAVVGVVALMRGGAGSPIIIAIGLQKAFESASDLWFGLFQREQRLNWMGQSVVLRSTLASVAFVGVMLAYGDLLLACIAGVVVRCGVFLLHDSAKGSGLARLSESGTGTESQCHSTTRSRIGALLKTSLPLAMGGFFMAFAVNIPRYFVEKRIGVAALGVFAALVYIFQAGAMLIDAMCQAACVRLSRYHLMGESQAFRRLSLKLALLAVLAAGSGVLVALAGGGPLLRLAYSAAFAVQVKPFVWLSVCALPWYCSSVFGYALVARRQMAALFYCQAASLAATLAASYWLIGESGLPGACRVVFLTYSVLFALYSIVLWRVPNEGGIVR